MALFPLFVSLENRRCLVVGGGTVALRKAGALVSFGARVTAVAPCFAPEWESSGAECIRRGFLPGDAEGAALVVAATDDRALNREIADACRAAGVPVNAVDDPSACTFFFPALVRRGPLTVGISTGGTSPSAAALVRRRVEQALPEDSLAEILVYLGGVRGTVKRAIPDEADRAQVFSALLERCMEKGSPLTEEEFQDVCGQTKGRSE